MAGERRALAPPPPPPSQGPPPLRKKGNGKNESRILGESRGRRRVLMRRHPRGAVGFDSTARIGRICAGRNSLGGGGGAGPRARDALLLGQTPRRVLRRGKRAGPRANTSWAARRKGREPNLQYGLQSTAKKFYDFLFIRSLLNGDLMILIVICSLFNFAPTCILFRE